MVQVEAVGGGLSATGGVLLALAEDREGPPGLGRADQPWLLPGFFPGRPRGMVHLRSLLTAYGLPSRRGRNSALMDLAAQMPLAVLSQVLSVGIKSRPTMGRRRRQLTNGVRRQPEQKPPHRQRAEQTSALRLTPAVRRAA